MFCVLYGIYLPGVSLVMVVLEVEKEVPRQEKAEGPRYVLGRLDRRGHHVRHVRREKLNLRVSK